MLCGAGDPSQDFKFSSFFPDFMEGPVDAVAGVLGVVFQLRHSAEAVAHHKTNVLPVTQPILGADSADAARRRWVVGRRAAAGQASEGVELLLTDRLEQWAGVQLQHVYVWQLAGAGAFPPCICVLAGETVKVQANDRQRQLIHNKQLASCAYMLAGKSALCLLVE